MSQDHRRLAAIMFTDIVGYSALTQRNEALALELLEEHRKLLRPLFAEHNGTEIKTIGDGFLVEFISAIEAVRAAVEMQTAVVEHNASCGQERQFEIRIGIHVGEVVPSEGDVLGDGVNIAARIEPLAEPGGICITEQVYDQVHNKSEMVIVRLGKKQLKNIEGSMEVYKVLLPWQEGGASTANQAGPGFRKKRNLAIMFTVVAVVLLTAVVWWTKDRLPSSQPSVTDVDEIKSVAVLPFVNLSAEPENEFFSDGMTEELIHALSRLEGVRVPARTSSFAFKGKNEDIRSIGEKLNVATVLEGSVRKQGSTVRITAQLIEVESGFHLWSNQFDSELEDVFAVQEEITRAIVDMLKIRLVDESEAPLVKRYTEDLEAHNLYLQGRFFWNKRTETGFNQAIKYFKQALEKDPNYALAYAGLADSYCLLVFYGYLPFSEGLPKARESAERALEIDESLGEAHTSLGLVFEEEQEMARAGVEYRKAIQLSPGYSTAHHWYASWLRATGQIEESLKSIQRAIELDPLSPMIRSVAGQILSALGQHERAREEFQRAVSIDPNFYTAKLGLARIKYQAGDLDGAEEEIELILQASPDNPATQSAVGEFFLVAGRDDRAKEHYQKAVEINPDYLWARLGLATIMHQAGDWEGAEREVDAILRVAPDNPVTLSRMGQFFLEIERVDRAREHFQKALEREPGHLPALVGLAQLRLRQGQAEETITDLLGSLDIQSLSGWDRLPVGHLLYLARQYDQAIALLGEPEEQSSSSSWTHWHLALIYIEKSMFGEALDELQKSTEGPGSGDEDLIFCVEALRGITYARMGEHDKARQGLKELKQLTKMTDRSFWIAALCFAVEENDQGFAFLERARPERGVDIRFLKVHPLFDNVRSDQRFTELLGKMGLQP